MHLFRDILQIYLSKNQETLNLKVPIEELILKTVENSGFELPYMKEEMDERNRLCQEFINLTSFVAQDLTDALYGMYIEKYVEYLRKICNEEDSIFKPNFDKSMLFLELGTLVKRVCVPLIRAIIMHPNEETNMYKVHAVRELTVVNPWISMQIDIEPTGIEDFAQTVKKIFKWNTKRGLLNPHDGMPTEMKEWCQDLLNMKEVKDEDDSSESNGIVS